eukprot:494191-Lingulodinium_polyedra.AAC.1
MGRDAARCHCGRGQHSVGADSEEQVGEGPLECRGRRGDYGRTSAMEGKVRGVRADGSPPLERFAATPAKERWAE